MNKIYAFLSRNKELIFQLVLHLLLFVFYSFDRHEKDITIDELAFFANYVFSALIINYVLLPVYYYQKKYWAFFALALLIVATTIGVEEFVLEKIFFPDTRGKHFMGIIVCMIDVLPIMLILVGGKFAWDASRKQQELDQLKSLVKESELQFLKSQINPHFLFNNLNNLYAYALENSPKTPSIILELSSVLRYMLYDCKEDFVPLSKELVHLENFTRLNELQIEDRGELYFDVQGTIGNEQIAPLILSVFVENAFKHSASSLTEAIRIDVRVKIDDGQLHFECSNTFGVNSNTDQLTNGIGLQNVRKRLQLLYPLAHSLDIQQENGVYKVLLEMNLRK